MRPNVAVTDLDPKAARFFYLRHGPLMLNQSCRLFHSVDRLSLSATELEKVQTLETLTADPMAPGDLSHVLVNSDKDRVVSLRDLGDQGIGRTTSHYVLHICDRVSATGEKHTNRSRRAFVQKQR